MPPFPEDTEIIARVLGGEATLFEILIRRHNQRVYRAVRSILRDESEVEDAMQQAYLSAFAHLAQFQGAAKFSTWLTKIAVNEACSRTRGRPAPVVVTGEIDAVAQKSPEEHAANRELGGLLEASVDKLPEIYRSVFMLREIEGLDTADAAEALSVSEEVIKTRLHRARELLQRELLAALPKNDSFPFLAPRCDRVVAAVLGKILSPFFGK